MKKALDLCLISPYSHGFSRQSMSSESHAVDVARTWRELSALSMKKLRCLARALDVTLGGRITKVDLQFALCQKLAISTSGPVASNDSLLYKSSIPPEVMPFYLEVGDLAGVWSHGKNWTTDLRGVPSAFDRNLLEDTF